MGQATEQEVRKAFAPYEAAITRAVLGAWAEWLASGRASYWQFNRSRANFVFEEIIRRALVEFAEDPRILPLKRNESYTFLVDGVLAFRFKKSDQTGLTSNYPTQAALEFHDPEQQLPGLPEVARVDVTYILNELQTKISDVMAVGRVKNQIDWNYSILSNQSDSNVVPIPQRTAAEPIEKRSLVRAKKPMAPSRGNESGDMS